MIQNKYNYTNLKYIFFVVNQVGDIILIRFEKRAALGWLAQLVGVQLARVRLLGIALMSLTRVRLR
jgi:hypothetical protein